MLRPVRNPTTVRVPTFLRPSTLFPGTHESIPLTTNRCLELHIRCNFRLDVSVRYTKEEISTWFTSSGCRGRTRLSTPLYEQIPSLRGDTVSSSGESNPMNHETVVESRNVG